MNVLNAPEGLEGPGTIRFPMLANHVENINGLLYVSGGGWTDHHRAIVPGAPVPISHLGIAASVTVPWTQTNRQHTVIINTEDDDGNFIGKAGKARLTLVAPHCVRQVLHSLS